MTGIGPSRVRLSRSIPSGAWAVKNARCSFEKIERIGFSPWWTALTAVASSLAFIVAEQT